MIEVKNIVTPILFYFLIYFYLFIFGCVGSSLLCTQAFASCGERGLLFIAVRGLLLAVTSLVAEKSHARALGVWASVVVARGLSSCGTRALERRLSSCGTPA